MIAVISDQCKRDKLLGYVKEVDKYSLKLKSKTEISSLQSKQVGTLRATQINRSLLLSLNKKYCKRGQDILKESRLFISEF